MQWSLGLGWGESSKASPARNAAKGAGLQAECLWGLGLRAFGLGVLECFGVFWGPHRRNARPLGHQAARPKQMTQENTKRALPFPSAARGPEQHRKGHPSGLAGLFVV